MEMKRIYTLLPAHLIGAVNCAYCDSDGARGDYPSIKNTRDIYQFIFDAFSPHKNKYSLDVTIHSRPKKKRKIFVSYIV